MWVWGENIQPLISWSTKTDQHCNPNTSHSIGNDSNLQAPTMEHKPQKFVGRDSINPNPTNDREIDIDNYNDI